MGEGEGDMQVSNYRTNKSQEYKHSTGNTADDTVIALNGDQQWLPLWRAPWRVQTCSVTMPCT